MNLRDFRIFIMPFLQRYRRWLPLTLTAMIFSLLLLCVELLLQRNFINALTGHNERGAWFAALAVAVCLGLRRLLRGWCSRSSSRIGYIGQNSEFLRGTLAENLSWGRENISRREQYAALARVGLGATLSPDCIVLEGASNLSGGERLRVAPARELLRDSDIIILDEATANLDPENERMIFRMIRREFQARTVILISHQSRVLEYADRTIEIDWEDNYA